MSIYTPFSFTATVKCQTPGFEGFLDVHEVQSFDTAEGAVGARQTSNYLTVNNFYNYKDVDRAERCQFRFVCVRAFNGRLLYSINVRATAGGLECEVGLSPLTGWLSLNPLDGPPTRLWCLSCPNGKLAPTQTGKFPGITLLRYDGQSEGDYGNCAALPSKAAERCLSPQGRYDSGKYWNAFLKASGGEGDPRFTADLYVTSVGG
ncbi:hypothetical protein [Pseudomonas sp. nanlin1]|uniref:hypothetical protein n=1 Tax=Pseudomonas sp. nanlin1 TaxID=3040605 RepID=UPI00388EF6F2